LNKKESGEDMSQKEFLNSVLKSSENFEEYKRQLENDLNLFNSAISDESGIERNEARKINLARMNRIEKQFEPSVEITELIKSIDQKLTWAIISENWCGDSAQNLPIIEKLSRLNENISLRIVLRDEHPEFMEKYLTNGKRSIPKLIILDSDYNQLAIWGPRPKSAQLLMDQMLGESIEKSERQRRLHLWYAKDKGSEVENEIFNITKTLLIKNNYVTEDSAVD
jgi:Thioredoxin